MRPRFLADSDLRVAIIRGFNVQEPGMDIIPAQGCIPDATPDPTVIRIAAALQCVLISHDRKTMPRHFYEFVGREESPGLILVVQKLPTGRAIDQLRTAWASMDAAHFKNRILYLR